jgi:UDP-3-O-[3-hydroxymyristoyl] glucosamine N-acyltransferase
MLIAALTVREVAQKIHGEVHGNAAVRLTGIQPLEFASSGDLSFFAPTSKKQTPELLALARKSEAGALLVPAYDEGIRATQIVTPQPMAALAEIIRHFYRSPQPGRGVHPTAVVDPSAEIGRDVTIGAFAVVGANTKIGDEVTIHPHVVIYAGAKIGRGSVLHAGAVVREFAILGNECLIQNGVVVGSDGFGYVRDPVIGHRHVPHIGTVVLGDRVDIGANSAVDRATLGETRIGEDTKLDNLVTVGHNVTIGRRSLLCGQVGIGGSCKIGSDVVLGGQAGVADHVRIGDGVRAAGQTGLITDTLERGDYAGHPQRPVQLWKRQFVLLQKLPELVSLVKKLAKGAGVS